MRNTVGQNKILHCKTCIKLLYKLNGTLGYYYIVGRKQLLTIVIAMRIIQLHFWYWWTIFRLEDFAADVYSRLTITAVIGLEDNFILYILGGLLSQLNYFIIIID